MDAGGRGRVGPQGPRAGTRRDGIERPRLGTPGAAPFASGPGARISRRSTTAVRWTSPAAQRWSPAFFVPVHDAGTGADVDSWGRPVTTLAPHMHGITA